MSVQYYYGLLNVGEPYIEDKKLWVLCLFNTNYTCAKCHSSFLTSFYKRFRIWLEGPWESSFLTTFKYRLSEGPSMVSLKLLLKTFWWNTFLLKLESERQENCERNCHVLHFLVIFRSNYLEPCLNNWKAAVTQKRNAAHLNNRG